MRPTSAPQYKYKMEYLTKNQTKGSIVLVAHDENEAQAGFKTLTGKSVANVADWLNQSAYLS